MNLEGIRIGFCLTGSYCTFSAVFPVIQKLVDNKCKVIPFVSYNVQTTDSRFGKAEDHLKKLKAITGNEPITTIVDAEPFGPNDLIDLMVVAPCTGNTTAKLTHGITDGPVTMAIKAHLRGNKPVVLSIATNDALGMNLVNIATLLNTKFIYLVPMGQDDPIKKPHSMIANPGLIIQTCELAILGKQIQPLFIAYK